MAQCWNDDYQGKSEEIQRNLLQCNLILINLF